MASAAILKGLAFIALLTAIIFECFLANKPINKQTSKQTNQQTNKQANKQTRGICNFTAHEPLYKLPGVCGYTERSSFHCATHCHILSNAIPNKWIEESFRGYSIAHEDRCQWLPGATDTDRTLKGSYILYVKACRAS